MDLETIRARIDDAVRYFMENDEFLSDKTEEKLRHALVFSRCPLQDGMSCNEFDAINYYDTDEGCDECVHFTYDCENPFANEWCRVSEGIDDMIYQYLSQYNMPRSSLTEQLL